MKPFTAGVFTVAAVAAMSTLTAALMGPSPAATRCERPYPRTTLTVNADEGRHKIVTCARPVPRPTPTSITFTPTVTATPSETTQPTKPPTTPPPTTPPVTLPPTPPTTEPPPEPVP